MGWSPAEPVIERLDGLLNLERIIVAGHGQPDPRDVGRPG